MRKKINTTYYFLSPCLLIQLYILCRMSAPSEYSIVDSSREHAMCMYVPTTTRHQIRNNKNFLSRWNVIIEHRSNVLNELRSQLR